jgi:hypothetical protein
MITQYHTYSCHVRSMQGLMLTLTFAVTLLVSCYFTLVMFQQMLQCFQEQNETETKPTFMKGASEYCKVRFKQRTCVHGFTVPSDDSL